MFVRSRRCLTQWLMLAMGSVFVIFGGVLYITEVERELQKLDRRLYREASLLISSTTYSPQADQPTLWEFQLDTTPLLGNATLSVESELVFARWYDPNNHLLMFFGPMPGESEVVVPGYKTLTDDGQRLRQLTIPLEAEGQGLGHLQVGIPLASAELTLAQTRRFLSIGLPLGVGLMGLVSWWFAGQMIRPIRQSYQRLEQFSADASHELRSPVASILNQAELGLLTQSPTDQRARLQRITELAQAMGELISSLFLLVSSDQPATTDQCNLTALAQDLATEFQPQAMTKGLHWELQTPAEPLWVRGEAALLRQAIANLLSNACRYTPPGGRVTLRLVVEGDHVAIAVEDNGIGIPPTDLPHIFERFYRVDQARAQETGGFGLGLAIAQQIVQAHGGTLQVHSQVDVGTTFTITLSQSHPRVSRTPPALPTSQSSPHQFG
ncbi:ATP-binding protein [Nodosilinea sp. P-1105]|uniref:sensor histidine kinase n=1 Tax=Nodosilinea sp. P-1105 TaxID=2546229 RepID=UPI001469F774|nr:ATP-binding protein [Nodosilinea sp. P-1105]NMF84475.1 two-component sensor histidine kinase [Nodosilinea sp. P-1105]